MKERMVMGLVHTPIFQVIRSGQGDMNARIAELWLDYRVACQFEKCWGRVESGLELAAVLRGVETPGQLNDAHRESPPASFRWIEQVAFSNEASPPPWFKSQELGLGTDDNYFDNQTGLGDKNRQRRDQWVRAQALEVRKVIKRTVRG